MDIRFSADEIKELTTERKKAIKLYTSLQPNLKELSDKGICRYFVVKKLQEELDVDSLSETQCKKLDNCKDKETREHLSKEFPKHDVAYGLFCISSNMIEEMGSKSILSLDMLDTYIIEAINERIQSRLDLYSKIK